MDHKFHPSQIDATKCVTCKYGVIEHTSMATCECCSNSGNMEIFAGMLMCADCIGKEKIAIAEYQTPEKQEARLQEARNTGVLNINNILDKARAVDYTVQVRTDIHNAETVANAEVKAAIWANAEIPADQKQFEYAKFMQERITHLQTVIFDANELVVAAQNKQRAVQAEFNVLANSLRQDERDKLKILSPNYKPGVVSKPARTKSPKKPSFDKNELFKQIEQLHKEGFDIVTASMLQSTCVQRQMTPAQAADVMRKTFGAAGTK